MKLIECANEQEWLEVRKQYITASTIASILGLNRFKSAYTAWAEMTGEIEPDPPSIAMQAGHALEPVVAAAYEDQTGRELYDLGDFTLVVHPEYDIIACTPDRIHKDDHTPCELKVTQFFGYDGQSTGWEVQLQVQMPCLEAATGVLAALEKTSKLHIDLKQFNPDFLPLAMPDIEKFWECVQKEIPPDMDFTESTQQTLKRIYPDADKDKVITLDDDRVLAAIEDLQAIKRELKETEKQKREAEIIIQAALQDAAKAEVPGRYRISYPTIGRKGALTVPIELKEVLERAQIKFKETPESTYRRMTIKEEK